jgi:hypothetical protein
MLPTKNNLTAFYAKFMTLFDVFYNNLLRSETTVSCEVRLCACFTLNFVLIYIVLAHVLR